MDWIANHSDGWVTYPRSLPRQVEVVSEWHELVSLYSGTAFKPFAQSFYIDLASNPDLPLTPIHLGARLGRNVLMEMLRQLQEAGVNHVAFNLKYGSRPAEAVMSELAEFVLPHFPAHAQL